MQQWREQWLFTARHEGTQSAIYCPDGTSPNPLPRSFALSNRTFG